jgi:hypothetical protein
VATPLDPLQTLQAVEEIKRLKARYHETYEKVGGRWLVATIRLSRLRVDLF